MNIPVTDGKPPLPVDPAKPVAVLTAADRCDQCGARAWHHVFMAGDVEWFFCHHHSKAHRAVLEPLALDWLDESWAINPPKEFYN